VLLARLWRRNGYLKDRPEWKRAHPTLEARISVAPGAELKSLKGALAELKIPAGRPWKKARRVRVPIYGRDAVEALLRAVGQRPRRWLSVE
jgi:hypothetical protein